MDEFTLFKKLQVMRGLKVSTITSTLEESGVRLTNATTRRILMKGCESGAFKKTKIGFKLIKKMCNKHIKSFFQKDYNPDVSSLVNVQKDRPCCSKDPVVEVTILSDDEDKTDQAVVENEIKPIDLSARESQVLIEPHDDQVEKVEKSPEEAPSADAPAVNPDDTEQPVEEAQSFSTVLDECWQEVDRFLQRLEMPSCPESLNSQAIYKS
ncbi:uncharacterized protein LOC106669133 [Cimex lectularius]|uniref:Uncharacterized protein n=1 Tax=Cimex lectularius TaxID=79782 RepID=A0A8I6TG36_CIMLE|nr:uncharacterized protein LOC106669133 [Cimex lectularius]